jgi:molybdate transport system substrate-binding protein
LDLLEEEVIMAIQWVLALGRIALVVFLTQAAALSAAEIKVVSAFGMKAALEELGPQFQAASGHKLTVQYAQGAATIRRINAGEAFDVAVSGKATIDELTKHGKVAGSTVIARSGMGIAARPGTSKPSLGSVDAFKRTLLNAKSIAWDPEGTTGKHVTSILERLGITAEMKPKLKAHQGADRVISAVAAGEADFGFVSIATVAPGSGAEVVGAFPRELQDYVIYTAAVSTATKDANASKALISFLAGEKATAVLKAKGLERVAH